MKLEYQRQASLQPLVSALHEYHQNNPQLFNPSELDSELGELFRHHDVIHVVFGCDTSFHDEILTDVWSIFGSTISLKAYISYLQYPEITDIVKKIGLVKAFIIFLNAIPDAIKVFFRTRQMTQKWPWRDYEVYLNQPLYRVRSEFGIKIL